MTSQYTRFGNDVKKKIDACIRWVVIKTVANYPVVRRYRLVHVITMVLVEIRVIHSRSTISPYNTLL